MVLTVAHDGCISLAWAHGAIPNDPATTTGIASVSLGALPPVHRHGL